MLFAIPAPSPEACNKYVWLEDPDLMRLNREEWGAEVVVFFHSPTEYGVSNSVAITEVTVNKFLFS